jgi:hypothetical protein
MVSRSFVHSLPSLRASTPTNAEKLSKKRACRNDSETGAKWNALIDAATVGKRERAVEAAADVQLQKHTNTDSEILKGCCRWMGRRNLRATPHVLARRAIQPRGDFGCTPHNTTDHSVKQGSTSRTQETATARDKAAAERSQNTALTVLADVELPVVEGEQHVDGVRLRAAVLWHAMNTSEDVRIGHEEPHRRQRIEYWHQRGIKHTAIAAADQTGSSRKQAAHSGASTAANFTHLRCQPCASWSS